MAELTKQAKSSDNIFGTQYSSCTCKSEQLEDQANISPLSSLCPQCGSKKLWRDAKRYTIYGDEIQRWLCRDCGLRFSDPNDVKKSWSNQEKAARTKLSNDIKMATDTVTSCQIGVTETKNLGPEQISIQQNPEKLSEINSKLVQFAWTMKQQGYAEETIRMNNSVLRALNVRGANLADPTSIKTVLALEKKWSQARRRNAINAYTLFLKFQGITWDKPICNVVRKFPFIPTEQEIDALIAGCSNQVAALLQLLKETAMRSGEAKRLQWIDINTERRTIILNEPEKNSLPRIWNVTPKRLAMLNSLPKKSQKVFGDGPINSTKSTFLKA
jgi:hypothetical protein